MIGAAMRRGMTTEVFFSSYFVDIILFCVEFMNQGTKDLDWFLEMET